MKSLLSWFILIVSIAVLVSSCSSSEDILPETTAPVIAEVTFVTTPTNDSTPNYTFSSDEAGTITYGGSCSSSTTSATTGDNTITLVSLSDGTYSNCTIIVTDSAGNASSALSVSTFVVDTTAPSVSSFTLSDTALITGDNATVTLVFSEAVASFSSSADITVANGTLAVMTSTDNITWAGTFTPTANTEDDNNTLSLATSYTDTAGNTGPAATTLNYVVDTTAPTVSSISPTDNQSSVSITDNITVTFSEAMEPSYVTTSTSDAFCAGTIRVSSDNYSTCVKMSSEPVSSNSNRTFTLDPYDNLTVGSTYLTRVTTGVKDTAGNAMSSQYDNSTGFAIVDLTAPTVSSVSTTADNQSSVAITDNITVTFSEAMDNTTVTTNTDNTTCYGSLELSSDNFSSCVQMSSAPASSSDNMTFTLNPSDNLTGSTTYLTRVTTGVKDSAGNTLSSQYVTSSGFTTESSPDTTLLAHYAFEGNLNDNSSYNRHLTEVGSNITYSAADNQSNKSGQAALFNGTNTFAYTNNITVGDNFTIAFWINPDSPNMGQWDSVMSTGDNTNSQGRFQIDYSGADGLRFNVSDGAITADLSANEWNHFVITRSDNGSGDNKVCLYKNGGPSSTCDGAFITQWDLLKVGENRNGGGYWKGYIDELKIYSRTFSEQEVVDHFGNESY